MNKVHDLKDIVKKLKISVREFAEVTGDSPQALNLSYDDLVLIANIKD